MDKKICVYAIAKNEIKFLDRWYESVKEADYICVLDTGSTDGTFEKLQKMNIITKQKKFKKFRFDVARNESMKLIPPDTDICVCVDIDEMFHKNWSKILKQNWNNNTRARYRYTWNFNPDGSEGIVFMADKIHKYGMYKWTHPVHEVLTLNSDEKEKCIDLPNIQLDHLADNLKSRDFYLPLLELSVKENPQDDRNVHYLGREYMFHGKYEQSIKTLIYHLNLKTATWKDERCASLRYIANCYKQLNDKQNQELYLKYAILETPYNREPYFDIAVMYYENNDFLTSAIYFEQCLKITQRNLNYISSPQCWSYIVYDYLSICYYSLGDLEKAIQNIKMAISLHDDSRLKDNLKIIEQQKLEFEKINQ